VTSYCGTVAPASRIYKSAVTQGKAAEGPSREARDRVAIAGREPQEAGAYAADIPREGAIRAEGRGTTTRKGVPVAWGLEKSRPWSVGTVGVNLVRRASHPIAVPSKFALTVLAQVRLLRAHAIRGERPRRRRSTVNKNKKNLTLGDVASEVELGLLQNLLDESEFLQSAQPLVKAGLASLVDLQVVMSPLADSIALEADQPVETFAAVLTMSEAWQSVSYMKLAAQASQDGPESLEPSEQEFLQEQGALMLCSAEFELKPVAEFTAADFEAHGIRLAAVTQVADMSLAVTEALHSLANEIFEKAGA